MTRRGQASRIGFIVSNGYGLGHVARMRAFAAGLAPYAGIRVMSLSVAETRDAFFLPSRQYLGLDAAQGAAYMREACRRFFESADPTHVVYDGNILPEGLLAALAARPGTHLTWVRRAMMPDTLDPRALAQLAVPDLVIEPGDIAQSYDRWRADESLARCYLKIGPVRAPVENAAPLDLDAGRNHALILPGAGNGADGNFLRQIAAAVTEAGLIPVIARWPIADDPSPCIEGVRIIETMPVAPHFGAFEIILSAAGYNSFHELMDGAHKIVFIPQEDPGRDDQLARARWAADRGYAQLCRRQDIAALSGCIARARPAQAHIDWFADWKTLAAAMGLQGRGAGRMAPARKTRPWTLLGLHRQFRRAQYLPHHFILALNMTAEKFMRKKPDRAAMIVTNSVDPLVLRRAGYKYLWLNDAYLTPHGVKRQFLAWLKIWRPVKISVLR